MSTTRQTRTRFTLFGVNLLWGLISVPLLLVILARLIYGLRHERLDAFDASISHYIHSVASPSLSKFAIILTEFGSYKMEAPIFFISAVFLLRGLRHTWDTVILFITLLGAWWFNAAMKLYFMRDRPSIEHLVKVGGYSFPSGHAMVASAFYGMLCYLVWLNLRKNSKPGWHVIVFTILFVGGIGASRVYLGVHYPSDVLAGFAAGGLWLIACIYALHAIRYYGSKN